MLANWKARFSPMVLQRGKEYAEEGMVEHIEKCGEVYFAIVAGSEEYDVEIAVNAKGIEEMHCSCPYAHKNNCKHMAAVLFVVESGNVTVKETPPAKKPEIIEHIPVDIPWLEAVDRLPEAVIRKEMLKLADRDERLKERLGILYLGGLPEGQLQNWKADLQKTAASYMDRWGRINFVDTWDFLNDVGGMLDTKLWTLLEVGAVMDAFQLLWIVMESALEWKLDDCDDELGNLFEDCEALLKKLRSTATESQSEEMLRWYQAHRDETWPGGVYYMDQVFRQFQEK